MTNYAGRAFTLKNGTWAGGVLVADCKAHTLKLNNQPVDITNKSSNGYRTLLQGAGTQSISITLNGIMTNDAGFETLQGYAFAASINAHAMQWADGDTLEGNFLVTDYSPTGNESDAQTFTCTLESSGAWTFTPA